MIVKTVALPADESVPARIAVSEVHCGPCGFRSLNLSLIYCPRCPGVSVLGERIRESVQS